MSEPSLDIGKAFRILVADDNQEMRELIFDTLTAVDYMVTCVEDGLEALASLQAGPYDLLITDYQMPRLNGLTLLKRLQAGRCCLPSILITGHISPELIEEAKQAGATLVLAKPLAISNLLSLVESVRANRPAG